MVVDWFGPKGLTHKGDDPWYLRVRSYSDGKIEVTWKSKSKVLGIARSQKEINFTVSDKQSVFDLFTNLDLELYAHQEKDRTSWKYKNWQFDLDKYPNMPVYLEIESQSEAGIMEAIKLLNLENFKTSSEGETNLIQNIYKLNWSNMRFD